MPDYDLDLSPGSRVVIRNLKTLETADFRIGETTLYKNLVVVYGETMRHGIRVFRGTRVVEPRPGCWVYVPGEHPARVMDLVAKLGGAPLVILQNIQTGIINLGQTSAPTETRAHPILQAGRLPGVQGYMDGAGKDGMVLKAMRLVDVYWEWREGGYREVPAWVRVARAGG